MSRTTQILVGVLVILLITWALVSTDRHHVKEKEHFLSNDTSQIDFVHIRNKDGEVTLKRVGGNWRVTEPYNYPANSSYTQTLLKKVAELELESLITRNKDKYEDYEVEGEESAYVEIGREGGDIDKFYCGKPSKTYTHTYLRREDTDEVWLVSGTPRSSFTRKPKDWRDKTILRLDKTMIERILLKFPDETVELLRTVASPADDTTLVAPDTSWQVIPERGKPFPPADRVMNRIRNTMGNMNSMDFKLAGIDTIPRFDPPEFTAEVFLEGDQHEVLDFVPDPDSDSRWAVRKNGNEETIFVVYKSTAKNLMKRPDDLKEKEEDKES